MRQKRTMAAVVTLEIIALRVILRSALITPMLLQQALWSTRE
jgi:hypothetical protein